MGFDENILSGDEVCVFEDRWQALTGVRAAALTMDLRNIVQGAGGAAVGVLPGIQLAQYRTDRPATGGPVQTGSPAWVSSAGLTHYVEDLSSYTTYGFFRRGVVLKLTSGTFARVNGLLYTSYRQMSQVFPAEEIVMNPTNDNGLVSIFPLVQGRPIPAIGVDKAKFILHGMGNDTGSTLVFQFYGRAFNDPLARGVWTALGSTTTPNAVDFPHNSGEVSLSGLSLAGYQWLELALGVYKSGGTASRCTFHVIPALTYV